MNIRRKIAHSGFVDCKTIILILSLSSLFFTYVKIEKLKAEYENENEEDIVNSNNNENQPIVFIGGSPRSGNTLFFNFYRRFLALKFSRYNFNASNFRCSRDGSLWRRFNFLNFY